MFYFTGLQNAISDLWLKKTPKKTTVTLLANSFEVKENIVPELLNTFLFLLCFRLTWVVFLSFCFVCKGAILYKSVKLVGPLVWPKCCGFKGMRVVVFPPFYCHHLTPLLSWPTSCLAQPAVCRLSCRPLAPLRPCGSLDRYRPRLESSTSLTSQTTQTHMHRHLLRGDTQSVGLYMWEWIKEYAQ